MATKKTEQVGQELRAEVDQDSSMPKVIWDDTNMETSYANACNIAATREEVSLFLGTNQTLQSARPDVTIVLSHRIVLNPYAAKRLMNFLERGLKEHEARYGELTL